MPDPLPNLQGMDPQTMAQLQAMGITTGGQLISLLSLMASRAPEAPQPQPQQKPEAAPTGGALSHAPWNPRGPGYAQAQYDMRNMRPSPPDVPPVNLTIPVQDPNRVHDKPIPIPPEILAAAARNLGVTPLDAGWNDGRQ
jgi:hypothetical protein